MNSDIEDDLDDDIASSDEFGDDWSDNDFDDFDGEDVPEEKNVTSEIPPKKKNQMMLIRPVNLVV